MKERRPLASLIRDAGFDPVLVGGMSHAPALDLGRPVYAQSLTPADLKRALGLTQTKNTKGTAL